MSGIKVVAHFRAAPKLYKYYNKREKIQFEENEFVVILVNKILNWSKKVTMKYCQTLVIAIYQH